MSQDRGHAPARFVVVTDERFLSAAECAERAHCKADDWWTTAKASPVLLAGRRCRGRRTFWLLSAVVEHLTNEVPRERVA